MDLIIKTINRNNKDLYYKYKQQLRYLNNTICKIIKWYKLYNVYTVH
jgi:hypothetical protein